jgi:hypothetical protein
VESSSQSRAGRSGKVFAIFWIAFSSIFVCVGIGLTWNALVARSWDRVPCVIERFEIIAAVDHDPPFRADLRYRYEIDGHAHEGTRLWKDKEGSDDYEDLAEVRERYAMGPEGWREAISGVPAECRVKPGVPETSVLLPTGMGGVVGGLVFAVFGGFFVLIGVAMLVGGKSAAKPAPVSQRGTENLGAAVVAFLFFGGAGLAMLLGLVLPKTLEWLAMGSWRETEAEVIWSRVRSRSSSDGTTYAVDLFYRYQVDGREYRSNRYDLVGGSSSGSRGKHEVVRAHPPGSRLTVRVDPQRPWRAVVERSPGWMALLGLFPLPFLAVGFFGLRWTLRQRHRGGSVSRPRGGHRAALEARRSGPPPLAAGEWVRAGASRVGAFIGLLVFALIWNGFILFFMRQVNAGSDGGLVGGFFSLFMIPFILVGIGVAAGSVYAFAAIFAPRFDLQLAAGELKPGRSVRLQWRRSGGFGETRDFALLLLGREEATYSQGSSNSTARSVFHEEVLFESTVPQAISTGAVSVRIPSDAVPTFRGEHNRIRWFLVLQARVPRLPDIHDEREILVLPPEASELP